MDIKELLLTLLQGLLVAVVPVITAFIVAYLKSKTDELGAKMENEKLEENLGMISNAVWSAVSFTMQTYVDALKKDKEFDIEKQKEALETALEVTKVMLTEELKLFITKVYGDIDRYLEVLIEQTVNTQKKDIPAVDIITGECGYDTQI